MGVDRRTYVIKTGGRPSGSGSYGGSERVKQLIAATQPGKITAAAQVYDAAGSKLAEVQSAIYHAAQILADHWSGPAADAAQAALRRLHDTAAELVQRTTETGRTLQWYGGSILPMYKSLKWPDSGGGVVDQAAAAAMNAAADKVMRSLNERVAQTWDGMPPQVEKNLPKISDRFESVPRTSEGDSSGSASSSAGSAGGRYSTGRGRVPHLSMPGSGGHGSDSGPQMPGGSSAPPYPGGTQLAGVSPDTHDLASGGLGTRPDPLSLGQSGAGYRGGGSAGTAPGFDAWGQGDLTAPGVPGPRAGMGRGSTSGSGTVGRGAGNNAPIVSGGARDDENERERKTWLVEDRDIWTGDEEPVPSVIGEGPNRAAEGEHDVDEILTPEELQELLDLVGDEPGEDSRVDFDGTSGLDFPDDEFPDLQLDCFDDATAGRQEKGNVHTDESSPGDLGIDILDVIDLDDRRERDA